MADNIIPGHLKVVRVEMNGVCNEVDDLKLRIGSIEEHIAGVRYDQSILHSDIAIPHKRLDCTRSTGTHRASSGLSRVAAILCKTQVMRDMHRPVTMDNFALLFNHIKLCERN